MRGNLARHPRPRPHGRARLLRRQAARRPRRRRRQGRAARRRSGAPARRRSGAASTIPSARSLWLALNTLEARHHARPRAAARPRALPPTSSGAPTSCSRPTRPGALAARGLGWDDAARAQPAPRPLLAHAVRADRAATPAGAAPTSPCIAHERQPALHRRPRPRAACAARCPSSYYHGGIEAAVGVAFALLARERTGAGQHVDVALQEAMVMPNMATGVDVRR